MELKLGSHSVHQLGLHIVFCTKYRNKVLTGSVEAVLRQVIGETCGHYGWDLQELEIMPDHVHLFVQVDHLTVPMEVSKTVKSISAIKLFTVFPKLKKKKFWGSGMWSTNTYYGSVGQVTEETIKKYLQLQKSK